MSDGQKTSRSRVTIKSVLKNYEATSSLSVRKQTHIWSRLMTSNAFPSGCHFTSCAVNVATSNKLNKKISSIRSTLRNGRLCKLQSHVTQKLGQISKIWPKQIWILCPSLRIHGQLPSVASYHCKWRRRYF